MTKIKLTNKYTYDVLTYLTLGATDGCIQDVSKLTFSDTSIEINVISSLMCSFMLKENASTYITAPTGLGFNGNVSFNTPPMACKTAELPNGMNLAEFIINNSFQKGGMETLDNSCVSGANAKIRMSVDTDDWTSNYGQIQVTEIENDAWDKNTGLVGVYPYGCDNCTSSVAPPSCIGQQPQYANAEPICMAMRPAEIDNEGTVEITFIDYL